MSTERNTKVANNDHERLEQFLGALPELQVREMIERLLTVAVLSETHQEMLEEYFLQVGHSAVFSFDNERVQEAYLHFNEVAEALDEYMRSHFFNMPKGVNFELYPDHKRGDTKQREFWEKHRVELEKLVENLAKSYRYFLNVAIKKQVAVVPERRTLKGATIKFDDNAPAIFVDDVRCNLPPFKNEHFLCRALFARKIGEAVDWSTIYEEMESGGAAGKGAGKTTKTVAQQAQSVKDAVHALNERIQEIVDTDDQLVAWEKKTVRRNF